MLKLILNKTNNSILFRQYKSELFMQVLTRQLQKVNTLLQVSG
jgi:hypothetical protein